MNLLHHSIVNFPILDYLKQHYPDGKIHNEHYIAKCPICNKNKLYFSLKELKGLCFRCSSNLEVREGIFPNLISFIMFTENIDYIQAIKNIKNISYDGSVDSAVVEFDRVIKSINTKSNGVELDDLFNIPIQVDIPGKVVIDTKQVEKYLNNRTRPMTMKILKLFPAWFSRAPFLKDRLIFEVRTRNSYAWLAYYIGNDLDIKNSYKTLNPTGSVLSCMLHGYNYAYARKKPLILTEGIFDAHRCVLRGYNAVACFGKTLSPYQVMLVNDTHASELVLAFDGDSSGYKGMWNIIKKWKTSISKSISMIEMPYGEDPDSISKRRFKLLYENRKYIV